MTFCASCGKELPPDVKFCTYCGAPVATAAPTPTPPPGPTLPPLSLEAGTGKYCLFCGAIIPVDASTCPKCGRSVMAPSTPVNLGPPTPVKRRSVALAVFLSILYVGWGQLYLRQIRKGLILFVIGVFLVVASYIFFAADVLYFMFWAYGLYDTYRSAKQINSRIVLQ
jgi:TM2 domain-containing membrane protein YozV/predicted nucleic acid-binding Zn ribbon protein